MTLRIFLLVLVYGGALAGQTFIQMSDPQFGMYAKDAGFEHETANFEFAIATANRLKPAFVIVTGDLINQAGNASQAAEYRRISSKIDANIRLFSVPGNHDVENEPTRESLETYRKLIGPDYYSFRVGDIAGFVLDSNLEKAPKNVPDEAEKMEKWLRTELAKARQDGVKHLIVFQHIPFFIADADEEDQYFNIPRPARQRYLALLHEFGVHQVFAGHYHRNAWGMDGDLEMVTTGPVGMPLDGGKSGIRVVTVSNTGVTHRYYDFADLP